MKAVESTTQTMKLNLNGDLSIYQAFLEILVLFYFSAQNLFYSDTFMKSNGKSGKSNKKNLSLRKLYFLLV